MGVRLSEDTNVALYDSVTGIAFGEVFQSYEEAEAFLEFVSERGDEIRYPKVYQEARNAWREHARSEWWFNTGRCRFCGESENDYAHEHGVCPDYEAAFDASRPEPDEVAF